MKHTTVKEIVIGALGITLVFLATYLIKIPNGLQGYTNLGDGFILLFASFVNPFIAFFVGGVGSGLADVVGGYGVYFIPTLFIKGVEALLISYLVHKGKDRVRYVAYIVGSCMMILGYFLADAWINQSFELGLIGIPGNVIQASLGILVAILAYPLVHKQMK